MLWNEILSFICIVCSALIYALSLQFNRKKSILITQVFSSSLYLLSYFFILNLYAAASVGLATAVIEIFRVIVFYLINKTEKFNSQKNNILAALFFSCLLIISAVFTWNGWITLLPIVGGVIVSFAMGSKNLLMMKVAFVIQSILTIIYLFFLTLWFNAYSQIIVLVFSIIGLVSYLLKTKQQKEI